MSVEHLGVCPFCDAPVPSNQTIIEYENGLLRSALSVAKSLIRPEYNELRDPAG